MSPIKKQWNDRCGCWSSHPLHNFATFGNRIVFPEALVNALSQQEFEAIITHEWQHLRWKDPHTKIIGSLIAHFFWWLPTLWWMK
ncbi:MAG: M48 family metalloprotease [Parachlamydiaceae bacterium]|nr:M48 family metalloprotease [Parachlamydiaceae bacterium]